MMKGKAETVRYLRNSKILIIQDSHWKYDIVKYLLSTE